MQKDKVGVAIIGTGNRGGGLAKNIARTFNEAGLAIEVLFDRNLDKTAEMQLAIQKQSADQNCPMNPLCTDCLEEALHHPAVRIAMIMMPSYLHEEYTISALQAHAKVFLEKPLAHNLNDAITIVKAESDYDNNMLIGFTRRYESSYIQAKQLIDEGRIGNVKMILIRNVIPYHVYYQRWHRRQKWSGGAINDKGSHLFDVMNWFAGQRLLTMSAFGGRSVFIAQPDAPECCRECDRDCPYRMSFNTTIDPQEINWRGESFKTETEEEYRQDTCVYAEGADILDHAVVNCQYENNVVGTYFFTVFGPKAVDQETTEVVGTKGRLIVRRSEAAVDLVTDYGKTCETIDCRTQAYGHYAHYGADKEIILEMRRWYEGKNPIVTSRDGLNAARMVEATHMSISNNGQAVNMMDLPDLDL